jgi:transcriptional regulator with XRE-family HTH domain
MSQSDLAQAIESKQSAIARLEDPTYGKHSIATLMKIAHAFDCALRVTLISYSRLAQEVEDTSDQSLYAAPFEDELHLIGR